VKCLLSETRFENTTPDILLVRGRCTGWEIPHIFSAIFLAAIFTRCSAIAETSMLYRPP